MLKPSLQLKLGQQLTMTPQLQQAIRLLQLPTIELQAHIRELLESNVMLEQDEDSENGTYESTPGAETAPETAAPIEDAPVEVVDDGWSDQSVGPAENPWSSGGGGDDDRQQEFADATGQTLREHLLWQLELARLNARDVAIGRAVVDAINDDGYLGE
ncbi:MAG TPA: RNA polymerase factor sigma-54, partial [Steroidobacteraceae bacterium]